MSRSGRCSTGRPEDLGLRRFFAGGEVPRDTIERVAALLALAERPVEPSELLAEAMVSQTRLATVVHRLQDADADAVEIAADSRIRATVVFDSVGYRTLELDLVIERGILRPA